MGSIDEAHGAQLSERDLRLNEARALRETKDPERRISLNRLIGRSFDAYDLSDADIFAAVYDDFAGSSYWKSWLTTDWESIHSFAEAIAHHNTLTVAKEERDRIIRFTEEHDPFINQINQDFGIDPHFAVRYNSILNAWSIAANNGADWLRGDISPLQSRNYGLMRFSDGEVSKLGAINWLMDHPDHSSLVPLSAVSFLRPGAQAAKLIVPNTENKGGRPVRIDWAMLSAEAVNYITENDYPEHQIALTNFLLDWATTKGVKIGDVSIERFVSALYKARPKR